MVGVPRSTGCRACLQRRVKCDQARPQCLRCQKRKIPCPGYKKRFRFYHQTTIPEHCSEIAPYSNDVKQAQVIVRPKLDETFAPNLRTAAIDLQLRSVFSDVVAATFPALYAAFERRVALTWVDFVRHDVVARCKNVTWGVRSLNTWYLARRHQDFNMLQVSRHMYNHALRCLVQSLRNPATVKSDTTLATAMVLGVYEMLDGVGPNSWVVHSRGIGALLRLRGPNAHLSGFGRTMFTTYRTFLIAEAFTCQEPCFLEQPEWRKMSLEALKADECEDPTSRLVEITENTFMEVVLCPGYMKRTHELIAGKAPESTRASLVAEIRRSRDILRGLQQRLAAVLEFRLNSKASAKRTAAEGLIREQFVPTISDTCLRGMDSALALLDQLLVLLAANTIHLLGTGEGLSAVNPWCTATSQTIPEPSENPDQTRPMDWLDQLALSMGTLALKT
ncbi:hypothetical protein BDV25DRAFT_147904 [Aspergillus avenaceus]|uniref:Zn(2)-C6 fungal-type domain-containing protein n=1 Tax=Aspergillus avenaceus TaxID=36643 RepID=A0A5N6U6S6_ASPAV|nr:hypothetical protein BDV25DRAFT_147904 [Aspergillus avenaceus]